MTDLVPPFGASGKDSEKWSDNTMIEKIYWLYAISPLHVGAGRGVGYIDLPIVRERVTNWPYVPGSAIKGVIADKWRSTNAAGKNSQAIDAAFGRASRDNSDPVDANAGSLVFSDASIVCLPVRSFYGTFAWVTSPLALRRLRLGRIPIPLEPDMNEILTLTGNCISVNKTANDKKVYLEDIDLSSAENNAALKVWGDHLARNVFERNEEWAKIFKSRFCMVNNDIFTFLCETGTDVSARIRINDDKKTVADRALWYEESLPIDTILSGVVWCDKVFGQVGGQSMTPEKLLGEFCNATCNLQIGGKASVGKGRACCVFDGETN
jgi:CRISPR-associated protein Cmr4